MKHALSIAATFIMTGAGVLMSILPAHACTPGERGEVLWGGSWYPATVLQASNGQCYITYEGYSSSWDEWVTPDRFRSSSAPATASYQPGDAVMILWNGTWYPGRILQVNGGQYYITYDGYSSSWDEWVGSDRLSY